jgi:TPR repeat protein
MMSAKHGGKQSTESLFNEADKCEEIGDLRGAFKHFLTAARLGDSWGQVNLGNYYASGTGVRKDLNKAAYWYKKAYKNGNNDGALNLAIDRRNQGNLRSAVAWLKKAIALNSGEACIELAKIYSARKGGRKAAASLLRRAMRMNRDNISDDGRDKAESLLRTL